MLPIRLKLQEEENCMFVEPHTFDCVYHALYDNGARLSLSGE